MMRITKRQLKRIIQEEIKDALDYETAADVEAVEDAFSGGENLHLSIDHSKAVGSDPVTAAPEMTNILGNLSESGRQAPAGWSFGSGPPGFSPMPSCAIPEITAALRGMSHDQSFFYDNLISSARVAISEAIELEGMAPSDLLRAAADFYDRDN